MAYRKIEVDNIICSRRFHVTFDDEGPKFPQVELKCQHCGMVVFEAEDHPAVKLARGENLIQNGELSDKILRDCGLEDHFSAKTRGEPLGKIY